MHYKAQKVGTLPGRGDIYQVAAPLDQQLQAFMEKGIYSLPTIEQVVDIRLDGVFNEPQKANEFTRTSIMPVALQGEPTILCKQSLQIPSLLMNPAMAAVAVAAHRRSEYVPVQKEFYEFVRDVARSQEGFELENRIAHTVSQSGDFDIASETDDARFCFGRRAQEYFKAKNHSKIRFYNLSAPSKESAVVNYTWFDDPQFDSHLSCGYRCLYDVGRAFGVFWNAAEGSTQKIGYTLTEIQNANSKVIPIVLKEKGVPALEGMLTNSLNEELLKTLRAQ